jgi:PKD repeat protein
MTALRPRPVLILVALAAAITCALALPGAALAVTCPNANPVVNENNCQGTGTTSWRLTKYDTNGVAGFATEPSVNLGSSVTLKVGHFGSQNTAVNIFVYRMGYYGGTGARLVHTATNVTVNNPFNCNGMDPTTGEVDCDNWDPTYTIPASALPASGVYLVRLKATDTGNENHVVFVVRNDSRNANIIYKLPTATYEAYNNWGNKSLYDYSSMGANTVSGGPRAVKVSFHRPLNDVAIGDNWFMKADYAMVYWLEKQGYDVNYTEDVSVTQSPSQLLNHKVDLVAGHDEYWTGEEMHGYKAARAAGVSVASFSGNTAYWKTRIEGNGATLVDYKTVQGSGSSGSGAAGQNDWGPDDIKGTADDALGADGRAGTSDDHPENSTTTWRDNGAAPGDPNAPTGGRVGPDEPENSLLANMYVGDNDSVSYPLTVPAGNGSGEYASDRLWRQTGVSTTSSTSIGSKLVGWEWDAVPTNAQYLSKQPAGVTRVTSSDTTASGSEWLLDEGRVYGASPPAGLPGVTQAVKYTASSGALVFSAGTCQWSWGLGPHWIDQPGSGQSYQDAPTDSSDARISQVTYNILSDMGAQPLTPVGITLDSGNQPPTASFTATPNPVLTGQTVTFDGSGSHDTDGSIVKYEWDLDGNGTYETTTTTPTTTKTYSAVGAITVGLRVTDNGGATGATTRTISVSNGQVGPYAQAVLGTAGVAHYWRFGDVSGTGLIDSAGTSNATQSSATLGVTGALSGDSDTAVRFNGTSSNAFAPVDLSSTSKTTIEFWLKWNAYANDDKLAMEFTSNFNQIAGGFLVDPNAPQNGGSFGVAIGLGTSRNNVFFARPSAGAWHHYAFVIDTTAAAATQIIPYVDGTAVSYTKVDSGTGAGPFANSTLNFMSRNGTDLFGAGDMDEVALYTTTLSSTTIHNHYTTGAGITGNQAPTASFTATPSAPLTGQAVTFDASASADPDGSIVKYEWDLDGNGTYETTTTTPTTTKTYSTAGTVVVGLRVTDNGGATGTTTRSVSITSSQLGPYAQAVLGTTGVAHYWRFGETAGTTLLDRAGTANATAVGGVTLGVTGALTGDTDTAARFDGTNDNAVASVDLSGTSKVTVEFWLKWNAYANDDKLAMEFTSNFNLQSGGFIVDPNDVSGQFAVGLGVNGSRNNVHFARPTAGAWHHYAFVMDTTASATTQIVPYVDGAAVSYTKSASGTGAGAFANSTLNVMSRNGASLFGGGDMDELALYTTTLASSTIRDHYDKGTGVTTNDPPTASFTVSPNPATTGQTVTFDGSASNDPNGSIVKYEWDLDGNGTYETTTTTPTTTKTYSTVATVTVGLRVTDNGGATATTTRSVAIANGQQGAYAQGVLATSGVTHYWRFGEPAGTTTLIDSKGSSNATTSGGPTLGVSGALVGDPDTAARFDGTNDTAFASVDLSATSKLTVEFWLKWSAYANDDKLAMEFTSNFNLIAGGFIVDPNDSTGKFAVGLGRGSSRNNVFFTRPSAGAWHHYAFVLDTTAAGASQITPYVDGVAIAYTKQKSGTGAGAFANSTLNVMSRNGSSLFGAGDMDDLALYNTTLSVTTIRDHYQKGLGNKLPTAAFTSSPAAPAPGQAVTFDASGSADTDGTIAKYEWDLDGDGSYETNTGTTPTATRTYAAAGSVTVGLRVTDNLGATDAVTHVVTVNAPPTAAFTSSPVPALTGSTTTFNASTSSDTDGSIVKYEWDLDGNGTFGTTTTTPSVTKTYTTAGVVNVRLRVTDDKGATATLTRATSVGSGATGPYSQAVFATSGLSHLWRFGETAGATLVDSAGSSDATAAGGFTLGVPGAPVHDTGPAIRFDGASGYAAAPVDLSATSKVTVEFWLKWNAYANDDKLAMEFTSNFNLQLGGFIVDPNDSTGKFAVGLGQGTSRNNVQFDRPSAGAWHHYALVLDTTAAAASQITPYVDGVAVPYTKSASGTGGGTFANSTLYFMTRGGSALFGAGDVDEIALYSTTLTGATVAAHYDKGINHLPVAAFTATPNPATAGQQVIFDGSGSHDADGPIADYAWDLDGNGTYETDTTTTATVAHTYATAGSVTVGLKVTDGDGATATASVPLTVQAGQPGGGSATIQQAASTVTTTTTTGVQELGLSVLRDAGAGAASITLGGTRSLRLHVGQRLRGRFVLSPAPSASADVVVRVERSVCAGRSCHWAAARFVHVATGRGGVGQFAIPLRRTGLFRVSVATTPAGGGGIVRSRFSYVTVHSTKSR